MKFPSYVVSSLLVISSLYFSLLLLQTGIFINSNLNKAAGAVNLKGVNNCPSTEHLRFHKFETMGPELIRRQDVGWLLNPATIGNPKGYLGDCYPYAKPQGVKRIIFLGDSFTGAVQVPYKKNFISRIQNELQKKHPELRIEVINLGIGGYGTDQQYLTLINEATKYSPDLIIHSLFLGNDIRDVSYELHKRVEWPAHWPHPIKRYITLKSNDDFVFRDADLNYYYEMNLMDLLGIRPWKLQLTTESLTMKFDYKGKIFGTITAGSNDTSVDEIDVVRFFYEDSLFSFHMKNARKWLDVYSFNNISMSGKVRGTSQSWHAEKPSDKARDANYNPPLFFAGWYRHFMLQDLRAFVKLRILTNIFITRYLLEYGLISKEDMPNFMQMDWQGKYSIDYEIFMEDDGRPEWINAWRVTNKLILAMRDYSQQKLRVPYVVFTIPAMESVYPFYWKLAQDGYPELRKDVSRMDVTRPTRLMEAFLLKHKVPHVSLYDSLVENSESNKDMLYGLNHAHFTEQGHEFVANSMIDFIEKNRYLQK
jgi:hypothetical protein